MVIHMYMNEYSYRHGAVYVFVNVEAKRVKVGLTRNCHDIVNRLNDVNDMWRERKVKCQICGTRLVRLGFFVPPHVGIERECPGGNELPFEEDVSLAESYLQELKDMHAGLSGSMKGSVTKRINSLQKRIELYKNYKPKNGFWQFNCAFITEDAEKVESLTHKLLNESLDQTAPFGEVFCCSVTVATEAVEKALSAMGILQRAKKETIV